MLPPENATGNWVKVTQRVTRAAGIHPRPDVPLEAGLSASVTVDTSHHRSLFGGGPAKASSRNLGQPRLSTPSGGVQHRGLITASVCWRR